MTPDASLGLGTDLVNKWNPLRVPAGRSIVLNLDLRYAPIAIKFRIAPK
jgi:hypothetical protein